MKEQFTRTAGLIGEAGVGKLAKASVCIFGLGGVGSYTVEALARAGVGSLTLTDGDTVSVTNINRQLYALHSTVGEYKTRVAALRVKDIDPDCVVREKTGFVTPDNIDGFFDMKYDFCVDAIDDTAAKTAIAVKCAELGIPLIASMGTGCKLDPSLFKISDIKKTDTCPLCRVMRKKYKDAGVDGVTVLWSPEKNTDADKGLIREDGKRVPGSISFVPSCAGLMIAGHVIKNLIIPSEEM